MNIPKTSTIVKKVLNNGLILLIKPSKRVPKVSIQLWYNVGSKDEKTGQKGIAHLIEHMIFKGTQTLSESDINMITYKLSGTCNAFTSYDYTGYLFDFPSHHWQEALPIMADCMRNCTFKQEFLNSEMKAVIQELKMYKDNYTSSLIEHMISNIFADHPYHYPIIGFKQDLWSLQRDALLSFYTKHYIPNNATLVVVGDVDVDKVYELVLKNFGSIEPDFGYQKESFYHGTDLLSTTLTLYRNVQQPLVMLAYVVPGARKNMNYALDILSWILGSGKGSRLQQLILDELQLATELETFAYDLFDYGIFFIYFQPKEQKDSATIIEIIHKEIESIINKGLKEEELTRAIKKTHMEFLSVLENNQKQAYAIGQTYLATGSENFLSSYFNYSKQELPEIINSLLKNYFKPSLMHQGTILPLAKEDLSYWHTVQEISDKEDNKILSNITREVAVEEGSHVHTIPVCGAKAFSFPKAEKYLAKNGLSVLYYHNENVPTIEIIINFKAKHYYDAEDKQGLMSFMSELLQEGTQNHTAAQLAQLLETYGMTFDTGPGYISLHLLSEDLEKGLSLLHEIITSSIFSESSIEKVRAQYIAYLKDYWDTPTDFASQLARDVIYKNHPYNKKVYGSFESIQNITREDILKCYASFITPVDSSIVLVGDLNKHSIPDLIERLLGNWKGHEVETITFPVLHKPEPTEIVYEIARDQIVLCFTGLSISRTDKAFDKLLLFDQIFTGGILGAMSSRLFALREQSGLFYTIGGSLLNHSDEQPGMIFIKTIVSKDRMNEAESAILKTIDTAVQTLTADELQQAKNALINSLVDNFESNKQIAASFLMLERFNLPQNYFDTRAVVLEAITVQEVKDVVHALLKSASLTRIKIGRI